MLSIAPAWRPLAGGAAIVAMLACLTAAAVVPAPRQALRDHPYFAVGDVRVTGVGALLTRTEVVEWAGVRTGMSLWDASPGRLRRRLEAHPMVARARVRREFPGRIVIDVRERKPEAILLLDEPYYVDRSGAAFGPLREEYSRDYPVITGVDSDLPAGRRGRAVRRALRLARLCDRHACFGGISEIHVRADLGAVLYPNEARVPVVLGWGGWLDKVDRAERLLELWSGETDRLASVDARFRNQVVVRLLPDTNTPAQPPPQSGWAEGPARRNQKEFARHRSDRANWAKSSEQSGWAEGPARRNQKEFARDRSDRANCAECSEQKLSI